MLQGFKALSADIESRRVLKIHFDHDVTDEDSRELVDAINAQRRIAKLEEALRDSNELLVSVLHPGGSTQYESEIEARCHDNRSLLDEQLTTGEKS